MRENASKKIRVEFKNETTLYKKLIATLRLGAEAFILDFLPQMGCVDTFGDRGERKEKKAKRNNNNKKTD